MKDKDRQVTPEPQIQRLEQIREEILERREYWIGRNSSDTAIQRMLDVLGDALETNSRMILLVQERQRPRQGRHLGRMQDTLRLHSSDIRKISNRPRSPLFAMRRDVN